jgi:hypothetical protein
MVSFSPVSFHDDREQRAPQDGETAGEQNEVVEEEAGFARDDAFQLDFAFQIRQTPENGNRGKRRGGEQEGGEVRLHRRLRKGVNGCNQPGARQRGAQNAEQERGRNQHHVPNFHHALFSLAS